MKPTVTWELAPNKVLTPRVGNVTTQRGSFSLPNFMPVATRGAVKGLFNHELRETGCEILLSNTYHLFLRPGLDAFKASSEKFHSFAGWDGPLLTDSGGYQVLSLSKYKKVTDDGVIFRSIYDGSEHLFTPERVVEIQATLGSTFMMQLDHLPPYTQDRNLITESLQKTVTWYKRSRVAHKNIPEAGMLVPILQGGCFPEYRKQHLDLLMKHDPPIMMAIGGLAVGEPRDIFRETLSAIMSEFPRDRIAYLMGVGEPLDMLTAIGMGVDIFDCVLPSRNGRKGQAFTFQGKMNLRNAKFKTDQDPIDSACTCKICRHYSRSYLCHLLKVKDHTAGAAITWHNLHFYFQFLNQIRDSIKSNMFNKFHASFKSNWEN
jgi:queuine tRNA-ribosyltransferase